MRRFAGWTLNALTVLSLVLCVAVLLAWCATAAGGYYARARLAPADRRIWSLGAEREGVSFTWVAACPHSALSGAYVTRHQQIPLTWSAVDLEWSVTPPSWSAVGTKFFRQRGRVLLMPPGGVWTRPPEVMGEEVGNGALTVRYGIASGVFVVLPLWSAASRIVGRWRRRAPAGCCVSCRYDLTGNVSGVCPECGTAVVKV